MNTRHNTSLPASSGFIKLGLMLLLAAFVATSLLAVKPKQALSRKDVIVLLDEIYGKAESLPTETLDSGQGCCLFSGDDNQRKQPVSLAPQDVATYLGYSAADKGKFSTRNRYEIRHLELAKKKQKAIVHVDLFKTVTFASGESENWYRQVRLVIEAGQFQPEITDLTII